MILENFAKEVIEECKPEKINIDIPWIISECHEDIPNDIHKAKILVFKIRNVFAKNEVEITDDDIFEGLTSSNIITLTLPKLKNLLEILNVSDISKKKKEMYDTLIDYPILNRKLVDKLFYLNDNKMPESWPFFHFEDRRRDMSIEEHDDGLAEYIADVFGCELIEGEVMVLFALYNNEHIKTNYWINKLENNPEKRKIKKYAKKYFGAQYKNIMCL